MKKSKINILIGSLLIFLLLGLLGINNIKAFYVSSKDVERRAFLQGENVSSILEILDILEKEELLGENAYKLYGDFYPVLNTKKEEFSFLVKNSKDPLKINRWHYLFSMARGCYNEVYIPEVSEESFQNTSNYIFNNKN